MDISAANRDAVGRIVDAVPWFERVQTALDVLPGMKPNKILHSAPPISWARMCDPLRGAMIGAILFEGLAKNETEAVAKAERGEIEFGAAHEHGAIGGGTGAISASMPVMVVRNRTAGNVAGTFMMEGFGRMLAFGAYGDEVFDRLRWFREGMGPAIDRALQVGGGIDLRSIMAECLLRGDELHNRNKAATSMLFEELALRMIKAETPRPVLVRTLEFLHENFQFFVCLAMLACKVSLDAGHGVPGSSIVTTMARNGTDFGIRVSGLGDEWFTGPAQMVKGMYFPGFTEADANPDIGDSAITETAGLGAFALIGAPAIAELVGGNARAAAEHTLRMYEITEAEHPVYRLPALDFRGAPVGIDVRKVVATGILPIIDTSINHKKAGLGMVGAGLTHPPGECFEKALKAFAARYGQP
jgi:uncharacterized protein DUF1116